MAAAAENEVTLDPKRDRLVITASSLGTVFEWYDFYLYGSLAVYIGATFFSSYPETTRNIFALLAFAAGFLVRPFGALVFGRLGDLVGRKYTFLVTILIMGLSTFLVGILPGAAQIGIAAPILLIVLRMLQGLALGEVGGTNDSDEMQPSEELLEAAAPAALQLKELCGVADGAGDDEPKPKKRAAPSAAPAAKKPRGKAAKKADDEDDGDA
eukprot:gene52978-64719_t